MWAMITINDHSSLEYIFYHRRFRIKGTTTYRALGIAPFRSLEEFSLRWWFKICHLVLQLLVFFSNFRNFVQKFSHKIVIWSSSWSFLVEYSDLLIFSIRWCRRHHTCLITKRKTVSLHKQRPNFTPLLDNDAACNAGVTLLYLTTKPCEPAISCAM